MGTSTMGAAGVIILSGVVVLSNGTLSQSLRACSGLLCGFFVLAALAGQSDENKLTKLLFRTP